MRAYYRCVPGLMLRVLRVEAVVMIGDGQEQLRAGALETRDQLLRSLPVQQVHCAQSSL